MYEGDPDSPATKRDLVTLKEKMQEFEARDIERHEQLRTELNNGYNNVVERITDSETRILKAFYSFAQSNSKRMTELEGNESAIRSRIGTIEDRLMEVERRLNIPPVA